MSDKLKTILGPLPKPTEWSLPPLTTDPELAERIASFQRVIDQVFVMPNLFDAFGSPPPKPVRRRAKAKPRPKTRFKTEPRLVYRLEHKELCRGPWSAPGMPYPRVVYHSHSNKGRWASDLPSPYQDGIPGELYNSTQCAAPSWRAFVKWFPRPIRKNAAKHNLVIRVLETRSWYAGTWQVVFRRAEAKVIAEYPPIKSPSCDHPST